MSFLLLSLLNKDAIKRAANFAPLLDNEKAAYWLYQISNIAIVVCLFFLKITPAPTALFCMGAVMYVAYFLFFFGCALLPQSLILFMFVLIFQISAHWIILSEERWCVQKFGNEYLKYMERVRRYF